jgi:hypothetical protein
MQDEVSPARTQVSLRMIWTALPRSSNSWNATGVSAGTRKQALPSAATGAVPRTCLPGEAFGNPTLGELMPGVALGSTCTTRTAAMRVPGGSGGSASFTFWMRKMPSFCSSRTSANTRGRGRGRIGMGQRLLRFRSR